VPRVPKTVLLAGLTATVLALSVAFGALGAVPHVQDEIIYTLQARLFAGGLRMGPGVETAGLIQYPFWVSTPTSYGVFPIGWPLLLALGELLGRGSWVNPLLVAGLPLVCWGLARELADARTAVLAAWVAALSPGIVVLAGSRMAHTSTTLALAVAALVVLRRQDRPLAWLGAGLAVAYVVMARPFDALVLGGPLLVLGGLRSASWRSRAALWTPALVAAGLTAWDNQTITGSWSTFVVGPWFDSWHPDPTRPAGCNALGFGDDRGCHRTLGTWGHDPAKAAVLAGQALVRLDRLLLGWPGGSALAVLGLWRLGRKASWTWAWCGLVVLAYALYWSPGPSYGARFYHPLYPVLVLWLAAGLRGLPRWAWGAAALVPLCAAPGLWAELSDRYWCVDHRLAVEARELGLSNAVVLVSASGSRSAAWPALGTPEFRCDPLMAFGEAFLLEDPTGQGLRIRHGPAAPERHQDQLRALWPDRPMWHLDQDVAHGTHRWQQLP